MRKYLKVAALSLCLMAAEKPQEPIEELEIDPLDDVAVVEDEKSADPVEEVAERIAASNVIPRPPMHKNIGTRKLLCIGVKYSTGQIAAAKPGCSNLAGILTDFWGRNSRGALKIVGSGSDPFDSGLPGQSKDGLTYKQARASYNKAVNMIKGKIGGYNYYVIPGIYTGPHAGGKVAHVKSTQAMTAEHETGHLIGLGHAGAYSYKGGKPELNAYGDTDSIMGRIISKYITAPQYYWLGWLKEAEIADYDPAVPYYDLGKIGDWNGLQTVIVRPKDKGGKWAFVSATRCGGNKNDPACATLHLATGGGSQKVFEVKEEGFDTYFTDLHVKVLKALGGGKIRVAIDYEPKPKDPGAK